MGSVAVLEEYQKDCRLNNLCFQNVQGQGWPEIFIRQDYVSYIDQAEDQRR